MRNSELSKTHDTFPSFASVRCDACSTTDMLRWYSILSFEFQCNVTTFSYLETSEIVSIVNFLYSQECEIIQQSQVDGVCRYLFLYFSHLSNSCIYKIVAYNIVEKNSRYRMKH